MDKDIQRLMANLRTAQLQRAEAAREEFGAEMEVRRALANDVSVCAAAIEIGHWDCDSSPIGICAYDGYEDTIHDNCLYCNEPEERK